MMVYEIILKKISIRTSAADPGCPRRKLQTTFKDWIRMTLIFTNFLK